MDKAYIISSLFLQVFKTSIALSLLKLNRGGLNIEEFVIFLKEIYKRKILRQENLCYHISKLKQIAHISNVRQIHCQTNILQAESIESETRVWIYDGILDKWISQTISIQKGLNGLIEIDGVDNLQENLVVPALEALLKLSDRLEIQQIEFMEQNVQDTLLTIDKIVAIRKVVIDNFRLLGKIASMLESNRRSVIQIAQNIEIALTLVITNNANKPHKRWMKLLHTFFLSYIKGLSGYEHESSSFILNFFARNLVTSLTYLFRNQNSTPAKSNRLILIEQFGQISMLLQPILKCLKENGFVNELACQSLTLFLNELDNLNLPGFPNVGLNALHLIKNEIDSILKTKKSKCLSSLPC